jgi:Na+-translocating ferredoxin:NAD+ oxidoreductase subunit C
VTVDESILIADPALVRAGAEALARAVGAREIVLAVKRCAGRGSLLKELYGWRLAQMPVRYPSGAERLIVEHLTRTALPAGFLPLHAGFLVHNVATIRAMGRAARDGVPCVERPLSVMDLVRRTRQDLIVPVGMAMGDVLEACGLSLAGEQVLVAGGLMMGCRVEASTPVSKGTTSIAIMAAARAARRERPCIRCGACNDICPVGVHPIQLALRVTGAARPFPPRTQVHLDECFLCGACSGVCPADIAIAARLRDAKRG